MLARTLRPNSGPSFTPYPLIPLQSSSIAFRTLIPGHLQNFLELAFAI